MKKLIVEALGTFFLALAVILSANPIAIGLMLMAMIYVGGHISGGHFNPAVTVSLLAHGAINGATALSYIAAQLVGGVAAAGIFYVLTDTALTIPMPENMVVMKALLPEALFTGVLCLAVLSMVTVARYKGSDIAGFVIGLTLTGIATIGGIFNPAIVLGGYIGDPVVHVVGPLLGALGAAFICKVINHDLGF